MGRPAVITLVRAQMLLALSPRTHHAGIQDQGQLGDIHYVRGNSQGSLMLDICTHLIDCILFLLGDAKPTAVWATAEGARNFDHPDERAPVNMHRLWSDPHHWDSQAAVV